MGFSGTDAGGFQWEGFNSGAPSQPPQRPRPKKPLKAVGTPLARVFISLGVTLLVGALYFYFELPAINLQSPDFYAMALLLCAVYCAVILITSGFQATGVKEYLGFLKKQCAVPFFLLVGLLAVCIVGTIAGSVILRADAYSELLHFERGENVGGLKKTPTTRKKTGTLTHWLPDSDIFTGIDIPLEYFQAARVAAR